MIAPRAPYILALALALAVGAGARARAGSQEPGQKDDALDSLLQKLAGPADGSAPKSEKPAQPDGSRARSDRPAKGPEPGTAQAAKGRPRDQEKPGTSGSPAGKSTGAQEKKDSPADVAPKDRELDELLQKLGETKETPAPDQPRRPGAGPAENKDQPRPARADQTDRARLGGKDKEIDQRLEELTGRRKKRRDEDEQRSGPVGQIIKEMRDVEQKLGKPDTGETTRNEQKQIVKRIETLIEEMQRSGASMRRMMVRRVRRPGPQPGQRSGSTPGAQARGVGPMKPAKPTNQRSKAGGKDVWGHLPPELRDLMENTFTEEALTAKRELIERYYLSINKGKLVREE